MVKKPFYRKVLSPAKLNLVLRIGPRRSDGYHELETLMVPLAWGDQLSIRVTPSQSFDGEVHCPGLKISKKKNLVYRAAENFSRHFRIPFRISISLKKNIPTGAGLGGGSGNAAMVLKILSEWAARAGVSKTKLKRDLSKIAAKLGADIPFFLLDSPAWCTGFGERCDPIKFRSYDVVVVMPKAKIPTPWAYRILDFERAQSKSKIQLKGMPSWILEDSKILPLENDFEEIALKYKPQLKKVLQLLARSGALSVRMSGSGSAFFGIYENSKSAKKAARYFKAKGLRAMATKTLGRSN